jgi:hypothetical protein
MPQTLNVFVYNFPQVPRSKGKHSCKPFQANTITILYSFELDSGRIDGIRRKEQHSIVAKAKN